LNSYLEQKKFLPLVPEFSAEFSEPPEFSGGVPEKHLCTGWAQTFDLQIANQIPMHHCPCDLILLLAGIFRPYL
jgi:hypothetical protein